MVRPIMEYACVVCDPITKKDTNKIEMVQKRAARFVYGDYRTTSSVTTMLNSLQWDTLLHRRQQINVTMLFRVINRFVLLCLFPVVLWLWHFLYSVGPHPASSLHIYTFVVSRALIFMTGAASQTGDADSSRAPGLTSGFQGSMNVDRVTLLLVPQWQCISSFVFYIVDIPTQPYLVPSIFASQGSDPLLSSPPWRIRF